MRTYAPALIGPALIVALAVLPSGCGSPEPVVPADLITYGSMGTRTQVDCAKGKSLDVSGSNNTLTVTGRCVSVSIGGADNTVTLVRVDEQLTVDGLNNTITYRDGDPRVEDTGTGNRISRG